MRSPLQALIGAAAAVLSLIPVASGATEADRLRSQVAAALNVSTFTVQDLAVEAAPKGDTAVLVELGGVDTALLLEHHSVRSDSFQVLVERNGGFVAEPAPASRTWRGLAAPLGSEVPVGLVRASIRDGSIWSFVRMDQGPSWAIQPLSEVIDGAAASLHVVYSTADLEYDGSTCGVDATDGGGVGQQEAPPSSASATGLRICEIGCEADFQFYGQNGSSVPNTVFDIEKVINGVESIYENDVQITYDVTSIVIRTSSASNPYTTNDSSSLLSQFRTHWLQNFGAVQRDVAHLFTGRNLSGSVIGVAYLNGICNNQAFGLVQSKIGSFASRVALSAHELGHNWSSGHCSGSDCRIMCPGLGGCSGDVSKFGSSVKNKISSYRNQKSGCLPELQNPVLLPFNDVFPTTAISAANWSHTNGAAINGNAVNEPSPPNSLNLDSTGAATYADDEIRSNYLLAQNAVSLTVSYETQHRGVESGEELVVEYWNDSLTWVELNRVTSNGVDQTSFVPFQHALPGDAFHDELRLRFRAEVNEGNDDWYVDDVRVDVPVPAAPTLASVSPSAVTVVGAGTVTLTGSGFASANLVTVGGVNLTPGLFTVVDDTQITLTAPAPTALGAQTVTVVNPLGPSNPSSLTYVSNDPPLLIGPVYGFNGQSLDFKWAGDANDQAFMAVNLDASTFSYLGSSLLSPVIFLPLPSLDNVGQGELSYTPAGIPASTQISTQIWTFDAGATDTSSLKATNVKTTQIIF